MNAYSKPLEHNIIQIDTGYLRPGLAACYLIIENGHVAVIDTGVEKTGDRVKDVLAEQGLSFENVDFIVPTHVHLDHAGGAGKLMQCCNNAQMIVHPFGSRHMIDPAQLVAGAEAVYGEQGLLDSVGEIIPVAEDRVTAADDLFRFSLADRELLIVDTPGHARHHFCIWDERSSGFFTGDTFGVAYPELGNEGHAFIFPPTTPVQFDPDAWHSSIDRLMEWHPERMYLTHFGQLNEPLIYMDALHRRIDDLAALALSCDDADEVLAHSVEQYFHQELKKSGCQLQGDALNSVLELDLDIIVQGLKVWLQRR